MTENIPGIKFTGNNEEAFQQDILKRFQDVPGGISAAEYQANILWSLREIDPARFVHNSDDTIIQRFNKIASLYVPDDVLAFLTGKKLLQENLNLTTEGIQLFRSIAPFYKRTI